MVIGRGLADRAAIATVLPPASIRTFNIVVVETQYRFLQ